MTVDDLMRLATVIVMVTGPVVALGVLVTGWRRIENVTIGPGGISFKLKSTASRKRKPSNSTRKGDNDN